MMDQCEGERHVRGSAIEERRPFSADPTLRGTRVRQVHPQGKNIAHTLSTHTFPEALDGTVVRIEGEDERCVARGRQAEIPGVGAEVPEDTGRGIPDPGFHDPALFLNRLRGIG